MIEVQIRQGESGDALCISALGMQVFMATYATQGIRASLVHEMNHSLSVDAVRALLSRRDTTFFLAEKAGHLLGFAQLTADPPPPAGIEGRAVELNRLYVLERFVGHGIGKQLLARAEREAARKGALVMWLTAWSGNARAQQFYLREGYKGMGTTQFTFGDESYENQVFLKNLPLP